jgi:predicted nucleotidyltransferase
VLSAIYLSPDALHIQAIAERTAVPYSTVQREVDRLEAAGLVATRRFGSARVARPNESHLLHPELRMLLIKSYGPQFVLSDLLRHESGVERSFVFGSWADRYHGNWGAPWSDVDVALVGDVTPRRAEELEAEIEDRFGFPTHVVVVPPATWDTADDPFIRTVKDRPLVEVDLGRDGR